MNAPRRKLRMRTSLAAAGICLAAIRPALLAHASRTPTPDDLWSVWTLSPIPAIALLLVSWLYARGVATIWRAGGVGRGIRRWQAGCFAAGMFAVAIAILSPLDTMGDALLAAHMTQHMLLLVVAPPLLVLGTPLVPLMTALPRSWRARLVRGWNRSRVLRPAWHILNLPVIAWSIATIVLWGWHVPLAYEAALRHPLIHDLEHGMFLGSSLLFWWAIVQPMEHHHRNHATSLMMLFTTAMQGSALGMLMTFSTILWYPVYDDRTAAWHLTPFQDQHLAGAVMWVPGGIVYLFGILLVLATWLNQDESNSFSSTIHQKEAEQWMGS